jgi:hypothetical protein
VVPCVIVGRSRFGSRRAAPSSREARDTPALPIWGCRRAREAKVEEATELSCTAFMSSERIVCVRYLVLEFPPRKAYVVLTGSL